MLAAGTSARAPRDVSTGTSGAGAAGLGSDGVSGLVGAFIGAALLDCKLGQINLLHGRVAENVVEAGDQFGADEIAGAGLFEIGQRFGGQRAASHVAQLRVVSAILFLKFGSVPTTERLTSK